MAILLALGRGLWGKNFLSSTFLDSLTGAP
jgi:hypothetical protein